MDSSASRDSKLEIRLAASTSEATEAMDRAAQDIGESLRGAAAAAESLGGAAAQNLDKAAESGKKAAAAVEDVGEKARKSAAQLKALAVGFGGMALNSAGTWLGAHGHDTAAAYLTGIGGGVMQGAVLGGSVGGAPGAVLGGVAGGAFGAFNAYQTTEARRRAEEQARENLAESLHEQLNVYEQTALRVRAFSKELAALGDESRAASARQTELSAAIDERRRKDEELGNAQLQAARAADQTRFAQLARDRAMNAQELARLEAIEIRGDDEAASAPERGGGPRRDIAMGDDWLKKGIDLFGGAAAGGVGEAIRDLARESLNVSRQQLAALNKIATARSAAQWL